MIKNKLIVLEGIDGSGKSSTSELLAEKLNSNGHRTVAIKSPIGDFGKSVDYVNNECSILSHYLFYLSGVVHTSDVIRKLLTETHVVCDRYIYSTQAYHLGQGILPLIDVQSLSLVIPDFVFYLTVSDESIRRSRINSRTANAKGDEEVFSKNSLLDKIDKEFRRQKLMPIDNTYKSQDELLNELLSIISL